MSVLHDHSSRGVLSPVHYLPCLLHLLEGGPVYCALGLLLFWLVLLHVGTGRPMCLLLSLRILRLGGRFLVYKYRRRSILCLGN